MDEESDQTFSRRDIEGTYRRGFHQGAAAVAYALKDNPQLTLDELEAWVDGACMEWRKDMPLDTQIEPPMVGRPASSARHHAESLDDFDSVS